MARIWTMEEEIFLIENYNKMPREKIAERIGIEPNQVYRKKYYLCKKVLKTEKLTNENIPKLIEKIKENHKNKIQKEKYRQFIKENHKNMTMNEMAKALGVSYATIAGQRTSLINKGKIQRNETKIEKKPNGFQDIKLKPIKLETEIPPEVKAIQKRLKRKIDTLDGNLELGRRYKIKEINYDKKKGPKRFEGELIQITDKHYTFKSRHRESFLKLDFVLGEYAIEEV